MAVRLFLRTHSTAWSNIGGDRSRKRCFVQSAQAATRRPNGEEGSPNRNGRKELLRGLPKRDGTRNWAIRIRRIVC